MTDKTENADFFDKDIEKYKKKYGSYEDDINDSDFVNELFESSDGKPITDWSMDDINKLINEVDNLPDLEEAGEEFSFDRYEKYAEPEKPSSFKAKKTEKEDTFDEGAVYFSPKYKDSLVSKYEAASPGEEKAEGPSLLRDFSSVEGNINEARVDGEFREIDESLGVDGSEQTEVVYDGTFDRGDYLKIKDIFKNSKILSKRRAERAEVRETAFESVKEKYGEAVFDARKKEADFNEILRRQKTVEKKKEEQEKVLREKKFDIDSEDYIVAATPKEEDLPVKEKKEISDTIFISELSHFEEIAKENTSSEEELSQTKVIGDMPEQHNTRNIYITPQSRKANDDQIRFEGFPEEEDFDLIPEEVNDTEIQENLRQTREEKKNLFRMTNLPDDYDDIDPNYFSPEKGKYDEEEYIVLSDENNPASFLTLFKNFFIQEKNKKMTEYTSPSEKPQVFKELSDRRRRYVFGLIAMSFVTLIFVVLRLITNAVDALPVNAQSTITAVISVISLLSAFIFGSCITQPGLQGILKKKLTYDSSVTILIFAGILNSLAMFFDLTAIDELFPVYTTAVLSVVIITCFSRAVESSRAINALKVTTSKRENNLYTIQSIDDEDTAQNIGRIFAGNNPDLKYSCKTAFPSGFVSNAFTQNPADRFSARFFPILAGLSLVIGIISGIVSKNVAVAFSSFTASLLVSFPVSLMPALNISLYLLNKKLSKKNAAITGYSSSRNIEKTNAVVVDSTDLFDVDKCNFHGMKDYGTVRVDDIILYAAAMLTNSRGPLANVFDKAIIGNKNELLPEVEDLRYEERLGLSGWIRGEKVLIGNRNLLINHNLEAPPKGAEVACLKEGKKVLYIAIDGQVAAMLVVGYAKNEQMKKYLSRLDRHGITVVVTTNDCNIDEDFLALEFNMPRESFKVVGDYEGGLLDGIIHETRKFAPAKMIHDGTSGSFFETFVSAVAHSSSIKISLAVQSVLIFLSLITSAIFALSGNLTMFSAGAVILVQFLTSLFLSLTALLRTKF